MHDLKRGVGGVFVYGDGQICGRLSEIAGWPAIAPQGSEQQWSRFAADSGYSQQDAGYQAGSGCPADNVKGGAPARHADSQR